MIACCQKSNTWIPTILGTLQSYKVLARLPTLSVSECQGNLSLRPPLPNSMLFIVRNSSPLVSNIVRGKGFPNSNVVISYCFQNSLLTHRSCYLIQACQGLLSGVVELSFQSATEMYSVIKKRVPSIPR